MHNIKVHGNLKGFKNLSWKMIRLRARFTNSLRQFKPSFGIKIVMSGFTQDAQWRISAEKAWTVIFSTWPYWICICRSFPFRRKMYGRSVLKWMTQCDLLMFVKLLVFAPFCYGTKKACLKAGRNLHCSWLRWSLWKWSGCVCVL